MWTGVKREIFRSQKEGMQELRKREESAERPRKIGGRTCSKFCRTKKIRRTHRDLNSSCLRAISDVNTIVLWGSKYNFCLQLVGRSCKENVARLPLRMGNGPPGGGIGSVELILRSSIEVSRTARHARTHASAQRHYDVKRNELANRVPAVPANKARQPRFAAFLRDVGEKVLHDIWRVFGYACERLMMLGTYLVVGWRSRNLNCMKASASPVSPLAIRGQHIPASQLSQRIKPRTPS